MRFEVIQGDFRGIFHFSYIINQKTKVCESLPPPHFTKIMYMYFYKDYYVEWGSWYKEGTMLQRQKKTKMRVVVDIIFVQKLTEV